MLEAVILLVEDNAKGENKMCDIRGRASGSLSLLPFRLLSSMMKYFIYFPSLTLLFFSSCISSRMMASRLGFFFFLMPEEEEE